MRIAVYPGTFDPITFGHIDILKDAARLFDEVILAVAESTGKNTWFSPEQREELCRQCLKGVRGVKVTRFSGLSVEYARSIGATVMIRGLRAVSDFEYELSLALMNRNLDSRIDTIFLVPDPKFLYLSSSMVRQVVRLGGDLKEFVPKPVEEALRNYHNNHRE